jgi:hypothetical protein
MGGVAVVEAQIIGGLAFLAGVSIGFLLGVYWIAAPRGDGK